MKPFQTRPKRVCIAGARDAASSGPAIVRRWVAVPVLALLGATSSPAFAEGSRNLYPATYPSSAYRSAMDLRTTQRYMNAISGRQFLYVYAQAGEYILVGSRNRANGGDVRIYDPQSFGTKADETLPATADFSCASATPPAGSYSGGSLGLIASRAEELAGPNSADNSVTVPGGFAPCAYLAPSDGIYGVQFTGATSGGGGTPNGSVANPDVLSSQVSAWDVTVRANATSTTDSNGRLFSYAWVGYTGANPRPVEYSLHYVTGDGYRYRQIMRGIDPNAAAFYANSRGFLDTGAPLYKDVRGNSHLVGTGSFPAGVTPQQPEYPIFFADVDASGPNAAEVARTLGALGIPLVPAAPELTNPTFVGNLSGNQSTVSAGGVFQFDTVNTLTYEIVISNDGIDFDPANPLNRVLTGIAATGSHAVLWDGLRNDGTAFPVGDYEFRIVGRNGEAHFPMLDIERNSWGGPTLTKLNGSGDSIVYFDDRGYRTRGGTLVGELNGRLCGAGNLQVPPTPDHSLTGVDSSVADGSGRYYRWWTAGGNSGTECNNSASEAFGNLKGLDLWALERSQEFELPIEIVDGSTLTDVGALVGVTGSVFPGDTVYGNIAYSHAGDAASADATGLTYTAVIGTPGNCPTGVNFTLLPAGVGFGYDSATCEVTFSGMPTTLTPGQSLAFNFQYTAPATGPVPVTVAIDSIEDPLATSPNPPTQPVPNQASASTDVIISDVATTITVPPTADPGDTVAGTVTYGNLAAATANAEAVTYMLVIGTPGSCPTGMAFPTLPAGVAANYNATTCQVSFTGMPALLAPGSGVTIGFTYTAPVNGGTIPVHSEIATTTPESTTVNNTADDQTVVVPQASLSVTKSGTTSVVAGNDVTYAITVANAGPSDAQSVMLDDPAPNAGITFVSADAPCAGGFPCALGTITAGGSVSLNVTFHVDSAYAGPSPFTNTAGAWSPTDPNHPDSGSPATGDAQTTVIAPPDLAIEKTHAGNFHQGQIGATYSIVVTNVGAGPTTGLVQVSETLPAGLTATTIVGTGWTCNLSPLGCERSDVLAAGASYPPIVLTVDVADDATDLVNGVDVATPDDPNPGNDHDDDSTEIDEAADIGVLKAVDDDAPNVGDTITYTVIATNHGPSPATNVIISDGLPAGLVFVAATPDQGSYDPGSGSWTIPGPLAVGASATLQLQAQVSAPGSIVNTATRAGGDQIDPVSSNNSSSAPINGAPAADLQVEKIVDNSAPNLGSNVTFTISVYNAGPSDATGVVIGDVLPAGLDYVSSAPSQGSYDDATGLWTVGSLAAGQTATLNIVVTVNTTDSVINNASVVGSDQFDPDPSNNDDGVPVNGQAADIQVIKTVDDPNATLGDVVTYTVTVTNNGPSAATNVTVTDQLPAGLDFVSATPSQGTYDGITGLWTIGNLDASGPGATVTLTIQATVTTLGSIVNVATSNGGDQPDPVDSNNSDDVPINGNALPEPTAQKSFDPATAGAGDTVQMTITLTNPNTLALTGVGFTDTYPAGLVNGSAPVLVSNTCGGTVTAAPGAGSLALAGGTIPASGSCAIVANVVGEIDGALVNTTGPIDSDNGLPGDPATGTLIVTPVADLAVTKTGSASVFPGDDVVYSITVENLGPSDADNVVLADPTPAGLVFVSADAPCAAGFPCALGTLASGSSVTIGVTYQVPSGYAGANPIVNTASASSDTPDPDASNNGDDANTAVGTRAADLVITKTAGAATVNPGGTVTWTIVVANNGPDDATGVQVTDVLPAGIASATTSGCAEDPAGVPTCSLGTIANGSSTSYTITAVVADTASGSIVNHATVGGDEIDPDPSSNEDDSPVDVIPNLPDEADLRVTKRALGVPVAGQPLTYEVVVANAGPATAIAVVAHDTLPASLAFVDTTGCLNDPNGVPDCQLGDLAAGSQATYHINVLVSASAAGSIVNQATVDSDTPDPNPDDNSSSSTVVVGGGSGGDVRPVPATDKWALLALLVLVGGGALVGMRRRERGF